jgi:hypothetical protein
LSLKPHEIQEMHLNNGNRLKNGSKEDIIHTVLNGANFGDSHEGRFHENPGKKF